MSPNRRVEHKLQAWQVSFAGYWGYTADVVEDSKEDVSGHWALSLLRIFSSAAMSHTILLTIALSMALLLLFSLLFSSSSNLASATL